MYRLMALLALDVTNAHYLKFLWWWRQVIAVPRCQLRVVLLNDCEGGLPCRAMSMPLGCRKVDGMECHGSSLHFRGASWYLVASYGSS